MRKIMLAATAAITAAAFMSDVAETIVVGGVRVNKADYEADQEKPEGERQYGKRTKEDESVDQQTGLTATVNVTGEHGVITTAAPSAPNFKGPDAAPLPMDETKGAVAPTATTADQLLVAKKGKKFIIVDGVGTPITGDRAKELGIAEDGYDSQEQASAVVTHTQPTGQNGNAQNV